MAHESSSKARLFSELSRSRQSSPYDENVYMTATGTSFQDVLHSTPLREPLQYPKHTQTLDPSEHGSDGSTDMSIEIGRGVKRRPNEDVSSDGIFDVRINDSQYEITATPPIPPRNSQRKVDTSLRREASIRRAADSIKANDSLKRTASGAKARATSATLPQQPREDETNQDARDIAHNNPAAARNTRFAVSRQPSSNGLALPTRFVAGRGLDIDYTPQRTANFNATVQSTTFTANQSFMLPDIPDLTELVSGVRKDGTPVINRSARSRSRFTSGTYKAQQHRAVESLPLPDEERAIIASLQGLKDRISELEAENSEAQRRAEQFEGEVIDLQSKLYATAKHAPPSEADMDDETVPASKSTKAAMKLEASLKAVQDRFNRSERKAATAQISVQRVTKERDALISQIAASYFTNEELSRENEELREECAKFHAEKDELKAEIESLRIENEKLRIQLQKGNASHSTGGPGVQSRTAGIKKLRKSQDYTGAENERKINTATGSTEIDARGTDIASRIEREVQRHRTEAATKLKDIRRTSEPAPPSVISHSVPNLQQRAGQLPARRNSSSSKRNDSASAQRDVSDTESTTELNINRKSRQQQRDLQKEGATVQNYDNRDITLLSELDEDLVANLRRKIEEEHRARRLQKHASIPTNSQSVGRKSSLKSVNGGLDDGTGRFSIRGSIVDDAMKTAKSVRVQSPHTSDVMIQPDLADTDAGDNSILSNTSRRRHRAASTEGMTSAFIIPDITIHNRVPAASAEACIQHNATDCTVCYPGASEVAIPAPVPVSERNFAEETTDATIRPAQPPSLALATVIKHLEDEITHLKLQRDAQNRLYNQHDPAISKRRRILVKTKLDTLTEEIEKRSDQVYALYDVLEGQKQDSPEAQPGSKHMDADDVEETLLSVGLDPAEISGRIGRSVPVGLDGADDEWSETSDELPWEGLSDAGSE